MSTMAASLSTRTVYVRPAPSRLVADPQLSTRVSMGKIVTVPRCHLDAHLKLLGLPNTEMFTLEMITASMMRQVNPFIILLCEDFVSSKKSLTFDYSFKGITLEASVANPGRRRVPCPTLTWPEMRPKDMLRSLSKSLEGAGDSRIVLLFAC